MMSARGDATAASTTTSASKVLNFTSLLSLIEQVAQQSAHSLEYATRRPRIFFGRPRHLCFRETGFDLALFRSGYPPRGSWRLLGIRDWGFGIRFARCH